jgi:hypothetical protein
MRVVESALAHFPKRRFDLIESIVDERVIAPNVDKRVLLCANPKKEKRGQQQVRNRSREFAPIVQKKGRDKHILLARVAHRARN